MTHRIRLRPISILIAVVYAGCATMSPAGGAPLATGEWHLVAINGVAAIPTNVSRRPTIRFSPDSGSASGSGGCNNYHGTATISGTSLQMSQVLSTKRACIDDAMNEQETRFFSTLESVDRYRLAADTLELFRGDAVALRFMK